MGSDDHENGSSFFNRKDNYDANSKIMLTAIISLSFVVLLVTLLHIYARYLLRRQARREAALRHLGLFTTSANVVVNHVATEQSKTGLDPSVIASLPIFVFKQTDDKSKETGSMECSVCLNVLEDGEMARTLPNCKHTFHAECIDKWFGSNSTCPICRTEAEPRLVAEPREGPSAPPLEGTSDIGGGTQSNLGKVSGSSSRLSSFRRILSRERSFQRINQTQSCGQENVLSDIERQ